MGFIHLDRGVKDMNENIGNGVEKNVIETGPETKGTGGFFASLIDVFTDPMKVFGRIDAGLEWWKPFVVLAAVNAAIAWFSLPIEIQIAKFNGASSEQLELMGKFGWVGAILAPIIALVVLLITAGLVNLIINLVSARSNFKKVLSLVCFTGLIGMLEQLITFFIVRFKGLETIESRADTEVHLGPGALFPEAEGVFAAVLRALSVFQIWYFIVFIVGLAAIFKINKTKAAVPAAVIWLIGLGFIMLGQKFAGGIG